MRRVGHNLTPREEQLMTFIAEHQRIHKSKPTWLAMREHLGYSNNGTLGSVLTRLEGMGYLRNTRPGAHARNGLYVIAEPTEGLAATPGLAPDDRDKLLLHALQALKPFARFGSALKDQDKDESAPFILPKDKVSNADMRRAAKVFADLQAAMTARYGRGAP